MQYEIEKLGAKSDGIATDGTFVASTLPGEVVEGEAVDGRVAKPRILSPSPDRVKPPCPHAKSCGGCSLQHVSDGFVANWKADQVRQSLSRAGLTPQILATATSPAGSRRRASLAGRRLKSGAMVGFHARASDSVVAVPDCKLLVPAFLDVVPALREITSRIGSRKGEITFHLTETLEGVDVAISGGQGEGASLIQGLADIARDASLARLTWDGETIAARRPSEVAMGRARTPIPPGAFLQATTAGEAALVEGVTRALTGARKVADLFCGAGTFTFPLAETAEVHGVEGDNVLLNALDLGVRQTSGLKPVTFEKRDLFRNPLLPVELEKYDGLLIDPPRAGAAAQVEQIAASSIKKLAYVACNPATFARDAAVLGDAGFAIDWVLPVDQFRWSTHVELVACLTRNAG